MNMYFHPKVLGTRVSVCTWMKTWPFPFFTEISTALYRKDAQLKGKTLNRQKFPFLKCVWSCLLCLGQLPCYWIAHSMQSFLGGFTNFSKSGTKEREMSSCEGWLGQGWLLGKGGKLLFRLELLDSSLDQLEEVVVVAAAPASQGVSDHQPTLYSEPR